MAQLTYTETPETAFRGMLADTGDHDVLSKAFEALANADAPFGTPMVFGTLDDQCKLPAGANDVLLGVSIHQMMDPRDTTVGIKDTQTVSILQRGRIWVLVEEDIAIGDQVWFRHTANGLLVPGGWGNDTDGGKRTQIVGARWEKAASAGQLALLDINIP